MNGRVNCWEYEKCGREEGGTKISEIGVCPASTEVRVNGINGGKNGGRACWAIAGTMCHGKINGSFALKLGACITCDFFKLVAREEGANLVNFKVIIAKLQ